MICKKKIVYFNEYNIEMFFYINIVFEKFILEANNLS